MKDGDKVRVTAPGAFHGHVGIISRITQHSKNSRAYYWVVFDSHPWQKPGVDWSFVRRELEEHTAATSQEARRATED